MFGGIPQSVSTPASKTKAKSENDRLVKRQRSDVSGSASDETKANSHSSGQAVHPQRTKAQAGLDPEIELKIREGWMARSMHWEGIVDADLKKKMILSDIPEDSPSSWKE